MARTTTNKKHQSDAAYVEAGLGGDETSRPRRNLQSDRNKVSRLIQWYAALYVLTNQQTNFLVRSLRSFSCSRNSQQIMEPQDSLLCSQELFIEHYPEPHESSPYQPILFL
jgi:hypothetical protein